MAPSKLAVLLLMLSLNAMAQLDETGAIATGGAPPPPGPGYYASTSYWNIVPSSLVPDTGSSTGTASAGMVTTSITAFDTNAGLSNGGFGVAVAYAQLTDPIYTIFCTNSTYNSASCSAPGSITFHVPVGTKATGGSDHHLIIVYNGQAVNMWGVSSINDTAHTISATSVQLDNTSSTGTGIQCSPGTFCENSMYATGIGGFGGLITLKDMATALAGGNIAIPHKLMFATPLTYTNSPSPYGFIACPATHGDNNNPSGTAIPEGALVYLDPVWVVPTSWPGWVQVIAKTAQKFGMFSRDSTGAFAIYAETQDNPNPDRISWTSGPSWATSQVAGGSIGVDNFQNLNTLMQASCSSGNHCSGGVTSGSAWRVNAVLRNVGTGSCPAGIQ